MLNQPLEESITDELRQITQVIEQITGLSSRWSGRVTIESHGMFQGAKRYDCSIAIREDLAQHPTLRWRTLIHEALHAFSPAYTRMQFDMLRGWEEGVVEQLQRLLRDDILNCIGVHIEPEDFAVVESHHPFNNYIDVLDNLRQQAGMNVSDFYLFLLRTHLSERVQAVQTLGNSITDVELAIKFRRSVLLAHAKLSRGPSYEP